MCYMYSRMFTLDFGFRSRVEDDSIEVESRRLGHIQSGKVALMYE